MASKKFNLEELRIMRNNWPDIPLEVIPEKNRALFKQRKIAVDMYIDGFSSKEIEDRTGLAHTRIPELIKRGISFSESGQIGYYGLIPNAKLSTDKSGKFNDLLTKHPSLKDFIEGNYFGDKKYTLEKNMNVKTLHTKFLQECLRLGIQEHEYPFNTENRGYITLSKYVKELKTAKVNKQAKRESKDDMQKLFSTGFGNRYTRNALAPFNVVQVDGHILDIEYTVEILNNDETISKKVATRAWLFAVIDVATRCILGYSVSQEFNYNQYDVMDAIKNAIEPHRTIEFTIKGLKYPDNGGYYSTAYPELKYALFDTIMLDNAKSHLAGYTVNKIVDELKCAINFGSVATPETRGIVERFFGSLETRGFHKLPATTGSNIRDLKRRNPEQTAIRYDITFDELCELIEALIAEYNNTPNSGIENLTPLESMRKKIYEAGMFPTLASVQMLNVIKKLNYRTDTRKVVGGKHGKRAYINFEGAEYRSNALSLTGAYIGQTITIIYDPRDISSIEAYTSEGTYIGALYARGEFGTKSHSLKTRKNANKLARERGRAKLDFDTPIAAYEQHLNEKGKNNRRDATKADIVRREQGRLKHSEMQELYEKDDNLVKISKPSDDKEYKYDDIKDLNEYEIYDLFFKKGNEA